jgi:hypothetical protein
MNLLRQLNLPITGDVTGYYPFAVYGSAFCLGLLNILLMAGMGALGGYLWQQMNGRKARGTFQ